MNDIKPRIQDISGKISFGCFILQITTVFIFIIQEISRPVIYFHGNVVGYCGLLALFSVIIGLVSGIISTYKKQTKYGLIGFLGNIGFLSLVAYMMYIIASID